LELYATLDLYVEDTPVHVDIFQRDLYDPQVIETLPGSKKLRLFMASFPYGVYLCPGDDTATTYRQACDVFKTWHQMTQADHYTFVVSVSMWHIDECKRALAAHNLSFLCTPIELIIWTKENRAPFRGVGFDHDIETLLIHHRQ
jgi:hypothetical protein